MLVYTVPEAAAELGVTRRCVRHHIQAGHLAATLEFNAKRVRQEYLITEAELKRFADTPRKVGRPRQGSALRDYDREPSYGETGDVDLDEARL